MKNRLLLRPQFSLRLLLLLTLVVSSLCAMLAGPAMTHRREVAIAKQIEELGGRAFFTKNGRPWGSSFFMKLGFEDVYRQIAQVDFVDKPHLTSKHIEFLSKLHRPTVIRLAGTGIDDAALKTLAQLDSLVTLDLSGTNVSEKGLYALEKLPNLETVQLSGDYRWPTPDLIHQLTYDELRRIAKRLPIDLDTELAAVVFKNCRSKLSHFQTAVQRDDLGVVVDLEVDENHDVLGALPHIIELAPTRLALYAPNNGDPALLLLSKADELETLLLPYNQVDGDTLRAWETLTKLTVLNLRNSKYITDEDIPALLEFRKLRVLNIGNSGITANGAEQLLNNLTKLEQFVVPQSLKGALNDIKAITTHYCSGPLPPRKLISSGSGGFAKTRFPMVGRGNDSLDWSIPGWKSTYHGLVGEVYVFEQ